MFSINATSTLASLITSTPIFVLERNRRQKYLNWLQNISPEFCWDYRHIQPIIQELERIINGERIKLIILMPPQHGKSSLVTIRFPIYYLTKFPQRRITVVGHTMRFVCDSFAVPMRHIMRSQSLLARERNDFLVTKEDGFIKFFGIQTGITGTSADLIIIDDPIKSKEQAYSQKIRNKIYDEFVYSLYTRRQAETSFILIQTPWHYDDLAARILANDKDHHLWKVLKFPSLALEDDPLGRKVGEPLCPELHSLDSLLEARTLDPRMFAALYQLSPEIEGGTIFKRDGWKYYDEEEKIEFEYILQSIDSAWETKASSDFSVCLTIGVRENNIYVIDLWREKVTYPTLRNTVINLGNKYKPLRILIEDSASGKALWQELRRNLPVQAIKPIGSKEVRAHAVTPIIDNGRVFLPKNAPYLYDFLDETAHFPDGAHDDIVDALTMALKFVQFSMKNVTFTII